jgi:hypothetical protein
MLLLFITLCACDKLCRGTHSKIGCYNNALCFWDTFSDEKNHRCEYLPCNVRTQTNCDPSVCRWDSSNHVCLDCSSLLTPTACNSENCCWYENKCHNDQPARCQEYETYNDCLNNWGAKEGTCYWNSFISRCSSLAPRCSDYTASGECSSKNALCGAPCYWYDYNDGTYHAPACYDTKTTCGNLKSSGTCTSTTTGLTCYWYTTTTVAAGCYSTKLGTCSYADHASCVQGSTTGSCYWNSSGSGSCSSTKPSCANYGFKSDCTADTCYWYAGGCHSTKLDCEQYSTTDCTSNTDASGKACYTYSLPTSSYTCFNVYQDCSVYGNPTDCSNNKNVNNGGACYWYGGKCNDSLLTECHQYKSAADCSLGEIGGDKCYWYRNECHEHRQQECFAYSTQDDCDVGNDAGDMCYWFKSACHKMPGPCALYPTQNECNKGTIGGVECYWNNAQCFSINPTCHS